jgi:uncharacterized membrane protein YdjX (TVP38/TMEM64 family)
VRKARHALLGALFFLTLAILWTATPLPDYVDVERLRAAIEGFRDSDWSVALMALLYLGASPAFFPITLLNMITAVVYEPAPAFAIALAGSMLNAGFPYLMGWIAGRTWLRRFMPPRLARFSRRLGRTGIPAVVGMMVTPLGPYTLVNMVCGASHIRLHHHQLGVALGLAPTLALLVLLGDGLWRLIDEPTGGNMLILAVIVIFWSVGGMGLQYLLDRLPGSRRAEVLRRAARREQSRDS